MNLITTLHHYCIDTSTHDGAEAWRKLRDTLEPKHGALKMHSHSGGNQPLTHRNESKQVILETKFLFRNQWNEADTETRKGRRLFDWYQEYRLHSKHWAQGHYLDITQEMEHARRTVLKCGYCGAHYPDGAQYFHCDKCLGSEYLKPDDLRLTRLRPIVETDNKFPPFSDSERAEIVPRYEIAQGLGKTDREQKALSHNRRKIAALVPEAEAKGRGLIEAAKTEAAAHTWLLDHGQNIVDNVIFYTHTQRFCFGWRRGLSKDEKSKLLDVLCEFPFDYDIKGQD